MPLAKALTLVLIAYCGLVLAYLLIVLWGERALTRRGVLVAGLGLCMLLAWALALVSSPS